MGNEILEEVWINGDKFAEEHNYGFDEIASLLLQEIEKYALSSMVDRRKKRSK